MAVTCGVVLVLCRKIGELKDGSGVIEWARTRQRFNGNPRLGGGFTATVECGGSMARVAADWSWRQWVALP